MDDQAAISSSVRQQPLHKPVPGCILQMLVQGEAGWVVSLGMASSLLRCIALSYVDHRRARHRNQLLRA